MRYDRIQVATLTTLLAFAGCSGTSVVVRPDPQGLSPTTSKQFSTIGVRAEPAASVFPAAGEPVSGFASALDQSGIADRVYYPMRPDDSTDAVFDTQIDVTCDRNSGSNFVKAFFTGFTMFLLEPFFWFEQDYVLSGNVDVVKASGSRLRLNATTTATASVKFLSLNEADKLEGEALQRGKESLYRQLLGQLQTKRVTDPQP